MEDDRGLAVVVVCGGFGWRVCGRQLRVDKSGVVDYHSPDLASEFGGEIWEQGEGGGHDLVRSSGNVQCWRCFSLHCSVGEE